MSEIFLRKLGQALYPVDDESLEAVKQMKPNQTMRVKYSFPRNMGNHRRFFVFVKTAFDSQEFFDNITNFRKWLIMKSGHYKIIVTPQGQIFDADSISFSSMGEEKFRKLFDDCVDVFLNNLGNGLKKDEFMRILDFTS